MACVVSDPVEESFISLVIKTGEGRRAVATITNILGTYSVCVNDVELCD